MPQLQALGVNTTGVIWQEKERTAHVTIYESTAGNKFFIAANNQYALLLDCPILAYSNEAGFRGTESAWKNNLLEAYAEQLEELRKQTRSGNVKQLHDKSPTGWDITTDSRNGDIPPLTTTRWGQDYPYNAQCPIIIPPSTRHLTGCVATAMAQLMYYHCHPQCGKGIYYGGNGNGAYSIDFSNIRPVWHSMQNEYPITMGNINTNPVAQLMAVNAKSVSSQFNMRNTAANGLAARAILVNHWNYSPLCKFIQSSNTTQLMQKVRGNIKRKLPVIALGGSHAFICDGYANGYYHFNLGWRGDANGYYKVIIANNNKVWDNPIINEIICDLHPDGFSTRKRTVNVVHAGTLASLLSENEQLNISELKIKGKLNGSDMIVLRRMMGATDAWQQSALSATNKRTGILQNLDLSEAKFVDDGNETFLRIEAPEGRFTYRGQTYNINDSKSFRRFIGTSISHGDGYRYVLHKGKPCIEFFVVPGDISPMMFFNCLNLRTVKLPEKTRSILGNAFQRCTSLERITLPSSVRQIESGAFRNCYLLRSVECSKAPVETCHNLFPFKVTGRYGEYDGIMHRGIFEGINKHTCMGIIINGKKVGSLKFKMIY